ncbi:MAG: hypothetical protein H6601_09495 [Flavobacteriales bacterium]|nr:hypothetical protein [Flavobacteriales bacterium]
MVDGQNIELLRQLNASTIGQLANVLSRIDQKLYTSVNTKGNASVGQHVRHTLEFYQCLFNSDETVNYDLRRRDIMIESSPQHARAVVEDILSDLNTVVHDRQLTLETEVSASETSLRLPTSFFRELFYVLEHAIHHMALIRVLIKDLQPDFELEDGFGVAYSTLVYRDQQANG